MTTYRDTIASLISHFSIEIDTDIQLSGRPPTLASSDFLTNVDWVRFARRLRTPLAFSLQGVKWMLPSSSSGNGIQGNAQILLPLETICVFGVANTLVSFVTHRTCAFRSFSIGM